MSQIVRPPRAKRFRKDMGIQFAITMALYELWIKDFRGGHNADTAAESREKRTTSFLLNKASYDTRLRYGASIPSEVSCLTLTFRIIHLTI
jgi:hypothetical protein